MQKCQAVFTLAHWSNHSLHLVILMSIIQKGLQSWKTLLLADWHRVTEIRCGEETFWLKADVENPKIGGSKKPVTFTMCITQPVNLIFHVFREHLISASAAMWSCVVRSCVNVERKMFKTHQLHSCIPHFLLWISHWGSEKTYFQFPVWVSCGCVEHWSYFLKPWHMLRALLYQMKNSKCV